MPIQAFCVLTFTENLLRNLKFVKSQQSMFMFHLYITFSFSALLSWLLYYVRVTLSDVRQTCIQWHKGVHVLKDNLVCCYTFTGARKKTEDDGFLMWDINPLCSKNCRKCRWQCRIESVGYFQRKLLLGARFSVKNQVPLFSFVLSASVDSVRKQTQEQVYSVSRLD